MRREIAITMLIAGALGAQDRPMSVGEVLADPRYREAAMRALIERSRPQPIQPQISEFDLQYQRMAETANRFAEKAKGGIIDKQLLEKFYREVHKLEQLKP